MKSCGVDILGMLESAKRKISIVTPTFNEEANVADVYGQVKDVFAKLPDYDYEHIFIDNASKDKTVEILKKIAQEDKRIKIIVNARNFGQFRSPYYAYFQASGDAIISMVADLQDPPELIKKFLEKWEAGYEVVAGIKNNTEEKGLIKWMRKLYYALLKIVSEGDQIKNFTGFGLYDRKFIEILRKLDEPDPYFRGLISEFSGSRAEVEYFQPLRKKGKTKNNFFTLYDIAMLGFVNHSKVPLRLASFIGFGLSMFSFLIALIYLVRKLIHWQDFQLGLAPLVVGIFFLGSVQLFFIGILGEYLGSVYTQAKHRPLVIEKERINF